LSKKVLPYYDSDKNKKQQVAEMFDNISLRYDFLNTLLSLGIHKYWQRCLIKAVSPLKEKYILDAATGTGAVAFDLVKYGARKVVGIDISNQMLEVGRQKIKDQHISNVTLEYGDAEHIGFDDHTFDAVTVAYGVRNFENLELGLQELKRVLHPGAKLAILEFSKPKIFPVKQFYYIYSRYLLPFIGKLIAKDKRAYNYLPESVQQFPEGHAFLRILQEQGFINASCKPLSFGIASLYVAYKP
jgi:demethylmenaquinone methyltransferase/2-methoxy-6-polyprenyl-1,4-benzoquinol methylase